MTKTMMAIAPAAMLLLVSVAATAAESEGDGLRYRPVEAFICKYREGKGPADLDAVNEEWNEWMDSVGENDYLAAVMTPHYHADYDSMDVGWLGVWRDGNAMGVGTDLWMNEGGDVGMKYFEVLDCKSGSAYVSTMLRAPKDDGDESDNSFVASFSNCSLKDDGDGAWDRFVEAHKAWNAYADENGIGGSAYLWWPTAGEKEIDWDFKYITAWDDHTMRGASWQKFADGHWAKRQELVGMLDCDVSRLYDAEIVRNMADDE